MRRLAVVTCTVLALLGYSAAAGAAPIEGTLTLSGGSVLLDAGAVALGDELLDWTPLGPGGAYLTVATADGYFTGMASTLLPVPQIYTGTTIDIQNGGVPPAGVALAPPGVPISVDGFLDDFTAPGFEDLAFELTFINLSSATPCTGFELVGQACSGPFSQFTLLREANGTSITMSVSGIFTANGGADIGYGIGVYSATVIGLTPGQILDRIASGLDIGVNGPIGWDAEYVSTAQQVVPEPATLLTFGVGSMLLTYRRRRAKK